MNIRKQTTYRGHLIEIAEEPIFLNGLLVFVDMLCIDGIKRPGLLTPSSSNLMDDGLRLVDALIGEGDDSPFVIHANELPPNVRWPEATPEVARYVELVQSFASLVACGGDVARMQERVSQDPLLLDPDMDKAVAELLLLIESGRGEPFAGMAEGPARYYWGFLRCYRLRGSALATDLVLNDPDRLVREFGS